MGEGGIHPSWRVIQSWPKPNYTNPATRGWELSILCIVLGVAAALVVLLRLHARFQVQKNAGLDDILIIAAMIPCTAFLVGVCLAGQLYDFNRHTWDVPLPMFISQAKVVFATEILYIVATGLIKLSILCFYRRLAANSVTKTFVYLVWASMAFVIAYMVTFIFVIIFTCDPISAYWNQLNTQWLAKHSYHCVNGGATVLAAAIVSAVQDCMAALMPALLFRNLQLPRKAKILLHLIFAVGLFTCAIGIVRSYYIYTTFFTTWDVTWESYILWAWTVVELLLGLICASAPALKIYVNRYLGSATARKPRLIRGGAHGMSWSKNGVATTTNVGTSSESADQKSFISSVASVPGADNNVGTTYQLHQAISIEVVATPLADLEKQARVLGGESKASRWSGRRGDQACSDPSSH